MSKPQKVSRRAASYSSGLFFGSSKMPDPERDWAEGYRAAMRDMQKLINDQPIDVFLSMRIRKFINDKERLK